MKKITMYEANDKSLHNNENSVLIRDRLLEHIDKTFDLLNIKADDSCKFSNGHGYYQLNKSSVENFDKGFIKLMRKYHPDICDEYYPDCDPMPTYGLIGRILSDSDCPIYNLHYTRGCIDKKYRRWGQCYFALNPDQGDQIDLGKKGE